ncbi:hypothetical protein [Lentzea albida]|uniref:Uncharacterized protein n=1 Tax=Lentzea albida TaxID=65499 RepID=A0A1H9VIB1_9PSEU|nr:hypothetical protein [Lentzea albida]SES21251.1 hypothetical protein SAMN04488000_118136 [Lentzea albida]
MGTRFDEDFETALHMMEELDGRPFMLAVIDLLNDIHREHKPDEGGVKCAARGCECWSDPDFSADWPCGTWMNAQRIAVAWLLERAQGVDKTPEERQREGARERKRRQREREGQGSVAPQVVDSCPEETDGGLPQGLAEASQVRSQPESPRNGKRDGNRIASAVAPAKASATASASPDLWTPEP